MTKIVKFEDLKDTGKRVVVPDSDIPRRVKSVLSELNKGHVETYLISGDSFVYGERDKSGVVTIYVTKIVHELNNIGALL